MSLASHGVVYLHRFGYDVKSKVTAGTVPLFQVFLSTQNEPKFAVTMQIFSRFLKVGSKLLGSGLTCLDGNWLQLQEYKLYKFYLEFLIIVPPLGA